MSEAQEYLRVGVREFGKYGDKNIVQQVIEQVLRDKADVYGNLRKGIPYNVIMREIEKRLKGKGFNIPLRPYGYKKEE